MRPLILVKFPTSSLSGGYLRLYEILKRGKAEGIDYTIITDVESCENAVKIFPDFMKIIGNYLVIKGNIGKTKKQLLSLKKILYEYKRIIGLALFLSKVAKEQNIDLIVYPGEGTWGVLTSYLASSFSSKPWTAIFQPGASLNQPNLFQPSYSFAPLNFSNVLAHIRNRTKKSNFSTISKIWLSIDFLLLLKISEKTIILTVSNSVTEDFSYLNPHTKIFPIIPGNGIASNEYSTASPENMRYHGVFFGRLIPEKGLFDLLDVWKRVVEKMPNAKLAVCGIVEEPNIMQKFIQKMNQQNLNNNVEILGQQSRNSLIHIVAESHVTLNPSYVDAFSLTTLESLACGTPVVAYNLPASRHNFGECKAVFRCSIGNTTSMAHAVLRVLNEIDRKVLTSEAKRFAASYDWNQVVKAEKDAYSRVINKKSVGRNFFDFRRKFC